MRKFVRGHMPKTPEEVPAYLSEMTIRLEEAFVELTDNVQSEKAWPFSSPAGSNGLFYYGGYYDFISTGNDFSPSTTLGTISNSYAAHVSFVLGATTVDELTLRVTGAGITDTSTVALGVTADIVIPNGTAVDAYFETQQKFLGQVTISVVSGTPKVCNYGWSKYWDNTNSDFTIKAFEATWLGGANDSNFNIAIIHHKSTGWIYQAIGGPLYAELATLVTSHGTYDQVSNNEYGAWKVTNLAQYVQGSGSEGVLFGVTTTANNAIELGTLILTISPVT